MNAEGSKKRESLTISDGGRAQIRRTHAETELDRTLRALFVAMCGKDGRTLNRNYANVACGHTAPWRMLVRRLREAKAARHDRHTYPIAKQAVKELDRYVDRLYGKDTHTTGEHRPAA